MMWMTNGRIRLSENCEATTGLERGQISWVSANDTGVGVGGGHTARLGKVSSRVTDVRECWHYIWEKAS